MNRRWRYYINFNNHIIARVKQSGLTIENIRIAEVEVWDHAAGNWNGDTFCNRNVHIKDVWTGEEFKSVNKEYIDLLLTYEENNI